MKLIVGLGNIGKEYENTRHNAGFMVVDKLAQKLGADFNQTKFNASIATTNVKGEKVIIMKPNTYMNLSGEAVLACVNFYKISTDDILVIHDDLDLPVGSVRIRTQGSAGGQKGMNNIINLLHTANIKRIRMGIDKSKVIPVVDYVLGKFTSDEKPKFDEACQWASDAAYAFIDQPFMEVMNKYNRK
ncbi:MAG: aminoacyl-tRNA hydrolase [Erysipelotrichaceae bacterium]|nr:aminoacyl-tRNA hydrolase [Erysipelotrichaceae bacterium]MDY5251203.1 aminoacyl-tRNA hydrolase [Erysipelotrichaceae bacterium]